MTLFWQIYSLHWKAGISRALLWKHVQFVFWHLIPFFGMRTERKFMLPLTETSEFEFAQFWLVTSKVAKWVRGTDFRPFGMRTRPFAALEAHFVVKLFQVFHFSYWETNSYCPRGLIWRKWNSPNFRNGWDRGDWVPRAFKLDNLQPFEPKLT